MSKRKRPVWWFIYWTFTGKGHPDHIRWCYDEIVAERLPRAKHG